MPGLLDSTPGLLLLAGISILAAVLAAIALTAWIDRN